jgi:hypothetical protein
LLQEPPPLQSRSRLHSTQVLLLQTGVEPPQSPLLVHAPPPPVDVQAFVVKSHVPPLQSRSLKHWMHTPRPEQSGVPEFVQSAAIPHSTHCPAMPQIGFAGSGQSEALAHWTHIPWAVSQNGVAPLHPEFAVQPLVHWRAETLHTRPFVQSVDARQATQRPNVASQTGFGAAHPVAQLGPEPPFGAPALDAPPELPAAARSFDSSPLHAETTRATESANANAKAKSLRKEAKGMG